MHITNEQRRGRMKELPESFVEWYGSMETARFLSGVTDKYKIGGNNDHIDVIGDVMLGFYAKSQLPALLALYAGIPQETARALAADLADFLKPVPDIPEQPLPQTTAAPKPTTPSPAPQPKAPVVPQPQPPTPERPGTLPKIETKLRDRLELRPEGQQPAAAQKPLDKNDLLDYLNVKRTMAADVAVAQAHAGQKLTPPPPPTTESRPIPTALTPRPGNVPASSAPAARPGSTPATPPLRPINFPVDKR